jgi:hypothetical protein
MAGHARSEPNDPGGTYEYEYSKVNSTLVHTTAVVQGESDIMEPYTHNWSGKDQALTTMLGICRSQSSGQSSGNGDIGRLLVAMACWAQQHWSGGGLAWGDILECLFQSMHLPVTGAVFTQNEIEVIQVADRIHQIVLRESQQAPQNRRPNYFIIVAHSQGNFFAEGIAYRLLHQAAYGQGPFIFHNRLGIVSLGSPTRYDSLDSDFTSNQLRHVTRADDGIHMLDLISAHGFLSKQPWDRSQDAAALWPWRSVQLEWAFTTLAGTRQIWDFMQLGLPALATPFMNAHLLDNYLTNPAATPAVLTVAQRGIPQDLATLLNIAPSPASPVRFQTPTGAPILSAVQQNVVNLKKCLLAIAKLNGASAMRGRC